MPVRKAVIPAAGLGTRFLPATKSVPKELIPVIDRPVIQYAVEELAGAGITDICIVISKGKEAVTAHFSKNSDLEAALQRPGKERLLEEVRRLDELATIHSVYQDQPLGLGHAVWVARDWVGDEPFMVALPDELFDPYDHALATMGGIFEEEGQSVVAVNRVPNESISAYGSIDPDDSTAQLMKVRSVIEKPNPAEAPSDLALTGRYVLQPEIFDILSNLDPGAGGEIQLTDGLGGLAERGRLLAYRYDGRRWDVGTKKGYLEAAVALGAEHSELGPEFRQFLAAYRGGASPDGHAARAGEVATP